MKTLLVWLMNVLVPYRDHMTRFLSFMTKKTSTLHHADRMKISPPRVQIKITQVSHERQTLLHLIEHLLFAFLLVVVSVFKGEAPSTDGKRLDPEQNLFRRAGILDTAFELWIFSTQIRHLWNVYFDIQAIVQWLMPKLTMHILKKISEN